MSWDLESILRTAGADRERPAVVEVGRTRDSRGLFWWTGRVAATVWPERVRLRRRLGVVGDREGLVLDRRALDALARASAAWARRRARWCAWSEGARLVPIRPRGAVVATWSVGDARVGLRLRLTATLSADLTRAALHAWREPGGGVWLEPGEEAFLAALGAEAWS